MSKYKITDSINLFLILSSSVLCPGIVKELTNEFQELKNEFKKEFKKESSESSTASNIYNSVYRKVWEILGVVFMVSIIGFITTYAIKHLK